MYSRAHTIGYRISIQHKKHIDEEFNVFSYDCKKYILKVFHNLK